MNVRYAVALFSVFYLSCSILMGQIESKNFDYFASNWTKVQLDKGGNVHDSQVFLAM